MSIRFGPAGLGGVEEAIPNLERYAKLGLKACEIAFTYGPYIKKEDAIRIGKEAERLGISLSIHAQYWINLNSEEKKKIEESKQRILKCLEIGTYLKAKTVVFHAGFYGKQEHEQSYQNIKQAILEVKEEAEALHYTPKLAAETTGKNSVFGSVEDIARLVEETGIGFCIDFAHLLAREKSYQFEKVEKYFGKYKEWHVHFSGINYGDKGEKNHIDTTREEWTKLVTNLPKSKDITIINESPNPVMDAKEGLDIYNQEK